MCALELAEGGGALVFELGVEQIAAADGGDVEAFWRVRSVLCFFPFLLAVMVRVGGVWKV